MGEQAPPASGVQALWELERFLEAATKARSGLSEIERGAERRGRELVRLTVQTQLDALGDGDVCDAIRLAGERPVRLAYKRVRSRRLVSIFGELKLTRMGYGAPGQRTVYPLDQELRLPGRSYSYECQRRLLRAIVCSPFDEAIALIACTVGIKMPKRAAEQLVREAAVDFEDFYAQRPAAEVRPARGEILVAAIDCKGIPMVKPERALRVVRRGKGQKANKKRMATVAAVHNQAPIVRTPQQVLDSLFCTEQQPEPEPRARPSHKRVWASLTDDKDTFIADVAAPR